MVTRRFFCTLLAAVPFVALGCSGGVVPTELYTTILQGSAEVPAKEVPGFGTASVSVEGGKTRVVLNVRGLIAPLTGAHIHVGPPGVNGPVVLNLLTAEGAGTRNTGLPGELIIDFVYDSTVAGLGNGTHYINVHTATNTGGEVRGDLVKA